MEEIVKLVANYGVSIVIIGLFIWDWVSNKKKINETLEQNEKCLQEISIQSTNISKSLDMLQKSMENQDEFLKVHDKRCGEIEKDIQQINLKMKGR